MDIRAWILPGIFLLFFSPGCSEKKGDTKVKSDLILVVIDTLRADHMGIYGHDRATTPNLDRLAAGGTWFRRAYAHSGWTLPSFASLLTGLLPHQHRVGRDPNHAEKFGRLPEEVQTLPELLHSSGYRCGAVINNTFLAPDFGLNQGFGADYDYEGATKWEIRSAEDSVDAALVWLEKNESPCFLLLHFMEPHLYYDPPQAVRGTFTGEGEPAVTVPFAGDDLINALMSGNKTLSDEELDYVEKLYDEEILAVDRALGRLLAVLRDQARLERTLVMVTSDHGEEFFDHQRFEHGHTLYSELTRIPLILHGPGCTAGPVDTVVQHVDLFQGICSLAGVVPPVGTQGEDLFALAREGSYAGPRVSLAENVLYGPARVSVLDGQYRLVFHFAKEFVELWELNKAGMETRPLVARDHPAEVRRLMEHLRKARGTLAPIEATPGPEIPNMEVFLKLRDLGYIGGE